MDLEDSGYSYAGESGWTTYLDCSSVSVHHFNSLNDNIGVRRKLRDDDNGDEEEEVDLSMVSDASSGPRYYCQEVEELFQEGKYRCSTNKNKTHEEQQHLHGRFYSCLDDTASSLYVENINRLRKEVSTQQQENYLQRTYKAKSDKHKNMDFLQSSGVGSLDFDHHQGANDKRKGRG